MRARDRISDRFARSTNSLSGPTREGGRRTFRGKTTLGDDIGRSVVRTSRVVTAAAAAAPRLRVGRVGQIWNWWPAGEARKLQSDSRINCFWNLSPSIFLKLLQFVNVWPRSPASPACIRFLSNSTRSTAAHSIVTSSQQENPPVSTRGSSLGGSC